MSAVVVPVLPGLLVFQGSKPGGGNTPAVVLEIPAPPAAPPDGPFPGRTDTTGRVSGLKTRFRSSR